MSDQAVVGILATIQIASFGYLAHRINELSNRLDQKVDRLTDIYIRHLEQHHGN